MLKVVMFLHRFPGPYWLLRKFLSLSPIYPDSITYFNVVVNFVTKRLDKYNSSVVKIFHDVKEIF